MNEEDLTIPAMEEKIAKVKEDLKHLQSQGTIDRRFEVLSEYLSYMEDELKMMKEEARNNGKKKS
jgi:hypothetical protein